MQKAANASESVESHDNLDKLRRGSLTCQGRYELEVEVDPAKKRTISLSAYAKYPYSASLMDTGGWRINLKKKPLNIKIVCETLGESLEHLTTDETARLRGVIEKDLDKQFKMMLAGRFKEQGVPVPDLLQSKVRAGSIPKRS